jgi:hypothetical protein
MTMRITYVPILILFLLVFDACRTIHPIRVREDKLTSEVTLEMEQIFRSASTQNGIKNLRASFVWERKVEKDSDLWLHFNYTQSELAHRPIDSIVDIRMLPMASIYQLPIQNMDINKAVSSSDYGSSYTSVRQFGNLQFSPEMQEKLLQCSGLVLRFHTPARQITYIFKGNRIYNIREIIAKGNGSDGLSQSAF